MFKAFLIKKDNTYLVSFGLNGNDFLNILPIEVQEYIEDIRKEDPEINETFNEENIIYLCAQKVVDITGIGKDKNLEELSEITKSNFF